MNSTPKRGTSIAIILLLATALVLLFSVTGCNTTKETEGVMATVNGRKILRTEVDKYYNNQTADAPQKPTDEQADTLRLNILKQLVDNEILMQRAEKLGLLATDDEVNSQAGRDQGALQPAGIRQASVPTGTSRWPTSRLTYAAPSPSIKS